MDELLAQHEEEKLCLKMIYEDGRELLREFVIRKCQKEADEQVTKAIADTKGEMEKKLSELVDKEVAQQAVSFEQQMENTLLNLESNDKDRMQEMREQCLKAMDLQSHLMVCRQITELLQVMIVEKQRWRMKNESFVDNVSLREHQSKSVKKLWTDFLQQLDVVDCEKFDRDDRMIFDSVRQFQSELMLEQKQRIDIADGAECFVIHEPDKSTATTNGATLEWINRKDNDDCIGKANMKLASSVDIKWDRVGERAADESVVGSFSEAIFNRFAQPQHSMQHHPSLTVPKVASSIMNLMRESKDEKELELNIGMLIQDAIMKNLSLVDATAAAADIIAMPKIETVHIKDSIAVMEKRVS